MKRVVVLILAVFFMTGVVYAKGLEVKKKAGDYNVEVRFDKNPAVAGDNNLEIEIRDAAGKSVTDAKVKVDYSMPAMPGMPAMNYKTDAALTGQAYTAKINLSMSGAWNVAVKITKDGKTSTVKFNVDAQ
ncbi:MAG: FixH family protein [Nitrospirae bacterium]|nr:FixH family protein [Nitrospirota bacterium]